MESYIYTPIKKPYVQYVGKLMLNMDSYQWEGEFDEKFEDKFIDGESYEACLNFIAELLQTERSKNRDN